ncbi:MinD/ParA family protein [Actinomadura sp. 9N215]|uniref:MinD/ParA family protein n=1 Tax=Actinomadura sp. 9N215 TaxID=3375150 RepID=UPI0037B9D9ED
MTSIRGGAGKSTLAALIAGVIRHQRGDQVIAIDADPGLGSLALRLGVTASSSLRHLAASAPRTWEETATHLECTHDGLFVLPAVPRGTVVDELTYEHFQRGTGPLHRYFSTAVIDCGAGLSAELQRGILATAHAQVFVTPCTADGVVSARAALDWLAVNGYGPLLRRTVIALVAHTPKPDTDLERASQILGADGLPVTYVPFDRRLATGVAINPERLRPPARTAATRIAVAAFARSLDVP